MTRNVVVPAIKAVTRGKFLAAFFPAAAAVQVCFSSGKSFEDLKVDANLQITYHDNADLVFADLLYERC